MTTYAVVHTHIDLIRPGDTVRVDGRLLEYTGRELTVGVSHMLTGPVYGLSEGWSILSIQPPKGRDSILGEQK